MSNVHSANIHHTLYKNLFISEQDASTIRNAAALILSMDPLDSVPNAFIEATIDFLYQGGYLDSINAPMSCYSSTSRRIGCQGLQKALGTQKRSMNLLESKSATTSEDEEDLGGYRGYILVFTTIDNNIILLP